MLTRPIPSTGEEVPVVGLGTAQVFNVGSEEASRRPRRAVLQALFDAGGRMIDTSPMYGRAEALIGELLPDPSPVPRPFIATKVWTSGRDAGIAQMQHSARLMRVDTIDLMQIHNLVDWRTHLATLRQMKERGDIRYIGITHYTTGSLAELARILDAEPGIDFVQCCYSLANRAAEERLLSVAAARRVGVIVNRPLETGGMFLRLRGRTVPPWAADFDCAGWAQLFLKYILAEPAVTAVIPATADPAHMQENVAAGLGPLPDAGQRQQIRQFWDAL
jgi:aryl-alcohol dehydrogenase-like predicted oxidoreductase